MTVEYHTGYIYTRSRHWQGKCCPYICKFSWSDLLKLHAIAVLEISANKQTLSIRAPLGLSNKKCAALWNSWYMHISSKPPLNRYIFTCPYLVPYITCILLTMIRSSTALSTYNHRSFALEILLMSMYLPKADLAFFIERITCVTRYICRCQTVSLKGKRRASVVSTHKVV